MTLVKKTFLVFVSAFIIQLAVIAVLLGFGFRQSENQWRQVRFQQAREMAASVLSGDTVRLESASYGGQIAIYDANGQLVSTNRGMGGMRGSMSRILSMATMHPVYVDSNLVGYYSTGEESFGEDSANKALLESMAWVFIASLILSLGISLLAALYFSKKVSSPADRMSVHLHNMTEGNITDPIVPHGSDELVRIAESIESLRVRLLHERTVRAQWSQDLAHDLRTPVASVKAQLEGMADGVLAPTSERFERTGRELKRMESLIDDLETLIRLESPETKLNVAAIDADSFANELTERFEAQLMHKSLRLNKTVGVESFMGDSFLLSRAVSNLLSNAIRYGDEGGQVDLAIQKEGGRLRIRVHNMGKPIPPSEIPKVFERLYRGEFARTSPGSGLGLTIVDRIATLHGGSVMLESTAETGTTVTLSIPASTV
ncbi:MAG: hypothetical protein A2Y31_07430 [Spirochaetes bacterium GWC2_52_13]|nr:MAG: hypothetical protein A2Y31_07430 [Spirochaetes bacterium GWC2_52_13]